MPYPDFREGDTPVLGYRLIRFIDDGGMGAVWEGRAPPDIPVAIKIVKPKRMNPKRQAIRWFTSLRSDRLVKIHSIWLLDRNGNVLPEWDPVVPSSGDSPTVSDQPCCYVAVMELGDESLAAALTRHKLSQCQLAECAENGTCRAGCQVGLDPAKVLSYVHDVAEALDYLNSPPAGETRLRIIHRDVKPANILLFGGRAKLCDYDIASLLPDSQRDEAEYKSTQAAFTQYYVAPETLDNLVAPTTDQYSLAITYYELRYGVIPYPEQVRQSRHLALLAVLNGHLDFHLAPEWEREVLRRATHKDPKKRYSSCAEFERQLSHDLPEQPPVKVQNRALLALFILTALFFLVYVGVRVVDRPPPLPPPNQLDVSANVQVAAVSPSNRCAYTESNSLVIKDLNTNTELGRQSFAGRPDKGKIAISADGFSAVLFVKNENGTPGGNLIFLRATPDSAANDANVPFTTPVSEIRELAISSSGKQVAVLRKSYESDGVQGVGDGQELLLVDMWSLNEENKWCLGSSGFSVSHRSIAKFFGFCANFIVYANDVDRYVYRFSWWSGKESHAPSLWPLPDGIKKIHAVGAAQDGLLLALEGLAGGASAGQPDSVENRNLIFFDVENLAGIQSPHALAVPMEDTKYILNLQTNADGTRFAYNIRDLKRKECYWQGPELSGFSQPGNVVAMSPDGTRLATGDRTLASAGGSTSKISVWWHDRQGEHQVFEVDELDAAWLTNDWLLVRQRNGNLQAHRIQPKR